ncbi:hypothetical protein HFC70_04130 [Agrobacterium sp. a22-2]|uniref:hypothetical protein n=1 Tax=Agrobacterium sp. a22-2 TaxID=2283840 RepID=UPI0014473E62|nr:hypothetical protein [Agrobacterium sp. a22-2]NKN35539.1 hypothetical protein [Agrobacterium sp. a22-2]
MPQIETDAFIQPGFAPRNAGFFMVTKAKPEKAEPELEVSTLRSTQKSPALPGS